MRTGVGLGLLLLAALLVFAGLALCLWGLYLLALVPMGASGAAVLIGALAMLLAGLLLWLARALTR
ncbi:hypothetical protein PVT67_16860 [Gallaecimonas kandeliae]|uniref:hypothetical protein n=1 Tax=Gallaecimonas kandeliae TaxID=3029055 RepID=UPI0026477AA0|nr:hypothetical protein [Gallaecimonas kandeliae]WKE65313.1 hypothetical protein PVT67_16860 [Gallaecimonas kandeliae]